MTETKKTDMSSEKIWCVKNCFCKYNVGNKIAFFKPKPGMEWRKILDKPKLSPKICSIHFDVWEVKKTQTLSTKQVNTSRCGL